MTHCSWVDVADVCGVAIRYTVITTASKKNHAMLNIYGATHIVDCAFHAPVPCVSLSFVLVLTTDAGFVVCLFSFF